MKIVSAQLNFKIADFKGNFTKISQLIQQHQDADLLVFTELSLSGYYPKDLIMQAWFKAAQNEMLNKICQISQEVHCAIVIGHVSENLSPAGKPYYNSASVIHRGQTIYTYHKRLLPVYNIFNESRHFEPGNAPGCFDLHNKKIGLLICEDAWAQGERYAYTSCNPIEDLAQAHCDVILCINGSPSNIGKQAHRFEHFVQMAQRIQTPIVYTNQVGGNDDIVFDGASFIVNPQGTLFALPSFKESFGTAVLHAHKLEPLGGYHACTAIDDTTLLFEQACLGLQDYVRKCDFKTVVLGLSGGIDSALTLALAVIALGAQNVTAIAMPSRYSTKASTDDARALCHNLNVQCLEIPIEPEFNFAKTQFEQYLKQTPNSLTEQNMQARLRGRLLMEFSNQTGALVLSTGNKSELSVGYTTLYGDMAGGFNAIGDMYKTDVYRVARHYNQCYPQQIIPQNILDKAPSAELAYNQKDSDTLPDYETLDPILKLYLEGDLLPTAELDLYQSQVAHINPAIIAQVHQMVNYSEYKRRQAPPIVRLQRRAFGMGRQFPIAAHFSNDFAP